MVRVRPLSEDEAQRLQRIIRRGARSIVTWRRAMVVLASAQGQKVSVIAKLVQTSEDRVREMIRNFNEAGIDSLFPKWSEGRPATFTPKVRDRICRISRKGPQAVGLPFTTWSIAKLRAYLVERRVVKTISEERLRQILAEEGITFQRTKTWKESPDPDKDAKLARIEEVVERCPDRVVAFDELGPLAIVPTAGWCWADRRRPERLPATYHKPHGVRQFFACYHVGADRLWGRMVARKGTAPTLATLKDIRARFPDGEVLYVILDNLNHHKGRVVRDWAEANNVELCFTPTYASWANPIECHFGPIRHFVLKNCNYATHRALAARLQAHIRWRNANARDPELLRIAREHQRRLRSERALRRRAKAA
jgi:transposase